jgi:hypothetical protein
MLVGHRHGGVVFHETLASVDQNIMRLIQVRLKKERKVCLCASNFLSPLSPSCLCFHITCPGVARACLHCEYR